MAPPLRKLIFGNLEMGVDEVQNVVSSLKYSHSVDAVTQMTITVQDPDFHRLGKGLFQLRMPVYYEGDTNEYEIAAIGTGSGGGREQVTLECRPAKCQRMKRDKNPGAYSSMSPTQYAAIKAQQHGLEFFGEPSPAQKNVVQASNDRSDESTWDVLKRMAGELDYWMFETGGRLFFTSQPYLLNRYKLQSTISEAFSSEGHPPIITYPSTGFDGFLWLGTPEFRKSDDDFNAATMDAQFERTQGSQLRPGMTIAVHNVPFFSQFYLVTRVEYEEGTNAPVRVSATTPIKPKPRKTDD